MSPSIIYCGRPGLDAEVIALYVRNSGYRIESVLSADGCALPERLVEGAVIILAGRQKPEEIGQWIAARRAEGDAQAKLILVLADKEFELGLERVVVIPPPQQLSKVVRLILRMPTGVETTD